MVEYAEKLNACFKGNLENSFWHGNNVLGNLANRS